MQWLQRGKSREAASLGLSAPCAPESTWEPKAEKKGLCPICELMRGQEESMWSQFSVYVVLRYIAKDNARMPRLLTQKSCRILLVGILVDAAPKLS